MTEVTVIIVSYKSKEDIGHCLIALEKSTHKAFRVIICENAGETAFSALRETLPDRLATGQAVSAVLAPDNLGYAGGINFALDHTPATDAYWILNPDCEPAPTALEAMVQRLDRGDCGVVGHDLVLPTGRLASRGGGRWGAWTARAISIDHSLSPEPRVEAAVTEAMMDYAVGASMLVSQQFLDRIGRMREDYFLYCEEIEWCLRGARLGMRVGYAPAARAVHGHGTSTGGGGALNQRSKLAVYLNERNRLLMTRDLFPARFVIVAPLALLHSTLKYAKAGAWRQLGYIVAGWIAGVSNERDKPHWWSENRA